MQVRGRGKGPIAPGEAPDGAFAGDTHPTAPGALLLAVPPLDQEHPALGAAGPGLRGGGPAAADGKGTQVPEGCRSASRGPRGALALLLQGPGGRAAGLTAPIRGPPP